MSDIEDPTMAQVWLALGGLTTKIRWEPAEMWTAEMRSSWVQGSRQARHRAKPEDLVGLPETVVCRIQVRRRRAPRG